MLSALRIVSNFLSVSKTIESLIKANTGTWQTLQLRSIRVIDGDTIQAKLPSGAVERIRLLDYDAPEAGQPGGDIATKVLKAILAENACMHLHTKFERDVYGRLLGQLLDSNFYQISKVFHDHQLTKEHWLT